MWAWRPSWSCDLYHLHELSFPLPKEVSHEIWHCLPIGFREEDFLIIMVIRGLLFKFVDFPHCSFNTAFIQY